jgi:signal transduction histidine kinase
LAARQRVVLAQRRALVAADRRALAGLFCASVAHDINNVLTVANAHVEQLGPQATPERRGPAFEAVRGALADLGALAKRMVALERGHGVPELRDRIFDGFITTKPDGSGLGLLSVRVTVAEHGGSVALGESDLGGAAFIVSLPAEPPPA